MQSGYFNYLKGFFFFNLGNLGKKEQEKITLNAQS